MSDELTDQIADLRQQVAQLQRERVTYRVTEVTATDPVSSTFTATLPDGGDLGGVAAPAQFLPEVGDLVRLTLVGATPIYEPERVASGSVTANMINGDGTWEFQHVLIAGTPTLPDHAVTVRSLQGTKAEPTYATGWTAYGDGFAPLFATKVGDLVNVSGVIKNTGAYSADTLVATLPVGYRPTTIALADGLRSDNTVLNPARYDIQPNGEIITRPAGAIPANSYHSINATFNVTI